MRVAVAGGGPGGMFLATLLRRADPTVAVTVFERNRADDTFGFGVVFSDRTLAGIEGGLALIKGKRSSTKIDERPFALDRRTPWGALVEAPAAEAGLPEVFAQVRAVADDGPVLVAVHGGTALTRSLVCEQVRLVEGLPALLVDDLDPDQALTAVLSGRADLVGVPA